MIFFFASAGASSAYLTVSEIFPMETRALAIAIFYAVGTGLGGIIGPVLFGHLIATKRPGPVAFGYLLGGVLMAAAGIVEIFLGVDAEQRPLEEISAPVSQVDGGAAGEGEPDGRTGVAPPPRHWRSRQIWSPAPVASAFPRSNPYLLGEVNALVRALEEKSPQSTGELSRTVGSQFWGPGRFREAVRSGLASGRIRRVGGRYAVADTPTRASAWRTEPPTGRT